MQYDWCPYEKRKIWTQGETHRENATWRRRQRLEPCVYKPKYAKDCKQTPEARKRQERFLPRVYNTLILDF